MSALNLNLFADSFLICNLRNREVYINAELAFEFSGSDFEVLFAETAENLFLCVIVLNIGKSGVLFDKSLHTCGNFSLIALSLSLYSH